MRHFITALAISILLLSSVAWKYQTDIDAFRKAFKERAHSETMVTANALAHSITMIYQGLRTIARLPGTRNIGSVSH